MARFVAPNDELRVQQLPSRRWRLLAPLTYESDLLPGTLLTIPAGFVTDFESVPRWLPVSYALLSGTADRAGVVHDWLTQVQKVNTRKVPRRLADAVYYEASGVDGNGLFRRWAKWLGVRLGGAWAYRTGPARFQVLGNERRTRPRAAA